MKAIDGFPLCLDALTASKTLCNRLHSLDAIGAARRGKRDHRQLDGVAIGGTYGDVSKRSDPA